MTAKEILDKLSAPFMEETPNGEKVPAHKWRVQSVSNGIATCVPYIDARQVSARLDEVVGFDHWASKIDPIEGMAVCTLSIKFKDVWLDRTDVGTPSNVEKEKGQASDALKRAAVQFGIGRYIYDIKPVKLYAQGKIPLTKKDGKPLNDKDMLTSFINTQNPWKLKLTEIYKAIPKEKQSDFTDKFESILNELS